MNKYYINRAIEVFNKEITAIESVRDGIDVHFAEAVKMIAECNGKMVLLGLGKSGHVAAKISSTFSSLGTPSFFINSSEALHGDLGAITAEDTVMIVSYSGEGVEIEQCLKYLNSINCKTICITGCLESSLALHSDLVLHTPVSSEACSLGLAPTSSSTATLVLGDALAVVVSEIKQFTASDFQRSHPGGELGEKCLK